MGLKFLNPKFNILCTIANTFFYKIPTLWSSEVNKAILEQVIVAEWDYYMLQFLMKQNLSSVWKHLYLVYHLHHLFEIIYESIFYNLKITLNYWFISKTINTRGNFIRKRPLGPWYPRNLT